MPNDCMHFNSIAAFKKCKKRKYEWYSQTKIAQYTCFIHMYKVRKKFTAAVNHADVKQIGIADKQVAIRIVIFKR